MSDEQDRIKKQIEQDRAHLELMNRQRNEVEAAHDEMLRQGRAKTTPKDEADKAPQKDESRFQIKPSPENDDWKKILDDYRKQYPNNKVDDNILIFPTREDAISFFQEQAAKNRNFFCREVDENNTLTGFNLLSCGNGKLYKGTLEDIKGQLKEDMKHNSNDENLIAGLEAVNKALTQTFKDNIPKKGVEKEAAPEEEPDTPRPG